MTGVTVGGFSFKPLTAVLVGGAATITGGAFVVFALSGGADSRRLAPEDDPLALSAAASESPAPSATATPAPASTPILYVVKEGDTCNTIALELGILEQLMRVRDPEIDRQCEVPLEVGQVLRFDITPIPTPDPASFVHVADLDGDPARGTLTGLIDPVDGLLVMMVGSAPGVTDQHATQPFRDWELFIAAAGTSDSTGGRIAVAGSERVARIDLLVDGGPPISFVPEDAPPELGYPLRTIYVTVPGADVWEFRAYDADGNYLGAVAHGSGLGAGDAYVERSSPGLPTPTPPGPRPDRIDGMSNGHVLSISPADGASVEQAETVASIDPAVPGGVCAEIVEEARGPAISLENVEFRVDEQDVTAQLVRYPEGNPGTSRRALLCFDPPEGLDPGTHFVELRLHNSADRSSGMSGFVWWQFTVSPPP